MNMDEQDGQDRKIGPKENPFSRGKNFKPGETECFGFYILPFYPVHSVNPCENPS
jgi:hypothetical protein